MLYVSGTQEPHSRILITGGPSDLFGSEILAKSDFLGSMSMKDAGIFLDPEKRQSFKKSTGTFLGVLKNVVIFFLVDKF